MKDLRETQQKLLELKGRTLGMECMINSILRALPAPLLSTALQEFDQEAEIAQVTLLNSDQVDEDVLRGFETYVQSMSAIWN